MKGFEIERTAAFVNLDGIPAAHGDMGLRFSCKMRELMVGADTTFRIAFELERLEPPAPHVAGDKAAVQSGSAACEEFHGFGDCQRSDQVHDRTENADGVASVLKAHPRSGIQQTGEARGFAWKNSESQPITSYGGGINPGSGGFDGKVIEEEPGFEIVGAIEDQRKTGKQFGSIAGSQVRDDTLDLNVGINSAKDPLGSDGLGENFPGVRFRKEGLPLEIGVLHKIAVQDAEAADAGTNEEIRGGSTNGATANQDGTGGAQVLLSSRAERLEKHLARVFLVERANHVN